MWTIFKACWPDTTFFRFRLRATNAMQPTISSETWEIREDWKYPTVKEGQFQDWTFSQFGFCNEKLFHPQRRSFASAMMEQVWGGKIVVQFSFSTRDERNLKVYKCGESHACKFWKDFRLWKDFSRRFSSPLNARNCPVLSHTTRAFSSWRRKMTNSNTTIFCTLQLCSLFFRYLSHIVASIATMCSFKKLIFSRESSER